MLQLKRVKSSKAVLNYLIIGGLLTVFGCQQAIEFLDYKNTKGNWNKNDTISFNFQPKDTLERYDLFLNLRTNNSYPFSNIFLIVKLSANQLPICVDTLEYQMAYNDGRLMGSGSFDTKESKLWYKENFRFDRQQLYQVDIVHAVRENGKEKGVFNLPGVTQVGFSVEKKKN